MVKYDDLLLQILGMGYQEAALAQHNLSVLFYVVCISVYDVSNGRMMLELAFVIQTKEGNTLLECSMYVCVCVCLRQGGLLVCRHIPSLRMCCVVNH